MPRLSWLGIKVQGFSGLCLASASKLQACIITLGIVWDQTTMLAKLVVYWLCISPAPTLVLITLIIVIRISIY